MEARLSGHGVYRTQYHIVWIPKYRRKVLNPGLAAYLRKIWEKVLREMQGVETVELNILIDHLHVIMIIPPKYAVAEVIGRIKGQTASALRERFYWLNKVYWKENIFWSPGYFVSTIGLNEEQILNYVRYQQVLDSGQAKLDL